MAFTHHEKVVLIVLDGWGVAAPSRANAISEAHTPYYDHLIATYPSMTLQASGEASGLPWGEVGNSEVGHLNIGAGRIVPQELTRITQEILNGEFFKNESLTETVEYAKKNKSQLHLMGLASSGGVHSHLDHILGLLEMAAKKKVSDVLVHAILDGRDTPRSSGIEFIKRLETKMNELGIGRIASISGRYYAMDRDNHWERTEKAYRAIIEGVSETKAKNAHEALEDYYAKKIYDENIPPTVISSQKGSHKFNENDAVIFTNFRADRARQLTKCIVLPEFNKFKRDYVKNLFFTTMTQYEEGVPTHVAYPPTFVKNCLAEVVSKENKHQLHVAETEKYAHVSYFINGKRENSFPFEKRTLVPSPSVASYDERPEMSALKITEHAIHGIRKEQDLSLIVINFANADMVGHTGNFKKTIKAIETVDNCLQKIVKAALAENAATIITADHGNAEHMIDLQTGEIRKGHTNNPVPCIIIATELEGTSPHKMDTGDPDLSTQSPSGILADIAPTILALLNIPKPEEMTGNNLLA